jgi:hypothetical protein
MTIELQQAADRADTVRLQSERAKRVQEVYLPSGDLCQQCNAPVDERWPFLYCSMRCARKAGFL